MPDPTIWHKIVTIFWIVIKWLDARFSRQAKKKKKADDLFKEGLKEKDKNKVLSALNRLRRSKK